MYARAELDTLSGAGGGEGPVSDLVVVTLGRGGGSSLDMLLESVAGSSVRSFDAAISRSRRYAMSALCASFAASITNNR